MSEEPLQDREQRLDPEAVAPDERVAPPWEKTATLLVYLLAVLAFAYIGYAWHTQKRFDGLVADLFSGDAALAKSAAATLVSTDESYPYLTNALKRRVVPRERVLAATVLRDCIDNRVRGAADFESDESRKEFMRQGLNLEAVTAALSDESPDVRWHALQIIDQVGLEQNYQRTRREEMLTFENLLAKLAGEDEAARREAQEELRQSDIRAIPYLVGVVFATGGKYELCGKNVLEIDDEAFRAEGLKLLRTIVNDVLKGSNQRRIVTLIGRRRTRLLLRRYAESTSEPNRKVLLEILNVSKRIPEETFTGFATEFASLDEDGRQALLDETLRALENGEKVRRGTPPEIEKAKKLSGDAGK